ncbi:hypothetical protein [Nonomuraea jiangxiensis]|uniref:Uncharacterized protein n=1 Tax=Nonomuraea jiangxiensis TaxID=633440 RepID=A0A1G9ICW8_9ACTN|nr:hypothetical protein [Nonomuraea jiangxiensis]SDL22956.1 hypothetical protein SAMN05421869_123148 [Nonomuraea jiangxiensis]
MLLNTELVEQLRGHVQRAFQELMTWDERHHAHLQGGAVTTRVDPGRPDTYPTDPGNLHHATLRAIFVYRCVLPFAHILGDMPVASLATEARTWLEVAARLLSRPEDTAPDGSITDAALIRRIGTGLTAWEKLGESGRAIPFLRAAVDFAAPNSPERLHAESLLRNLRPSPASQALHDIAASRDAGNYDSACDTAAEMLRTAARDGERVPAELLDEAEKLASSIETLVDRVGHRCDLLGALASYHASRGDHRRTWMARDAIAGHLDDPGPAPSIRLNDLAIRYYQHGDLTRAISCGLDNADLLLKQASSNRRPARTSSPAARH